MAWHQLSIITDKQTAPKVSDFFSDLGAVSVTYMDAEDQPVYEPPPGETKIWQLTKVIALFELDTEPELVKTVLFSQFKEHLLENWFYEVLQDQTWERTWMEHYRPMKFGASLWVCPTGEEKAEPGAVCMTLDPGLAFGTGTHPKQVYAIDIDPQAITATLANAEKNNVVDKIKCYLPEQFSDIKADIVIANILAKPLCELSEQISELIKANGEIILSGILNEQADSVMTAYKHYNINFQTPKTQEDWCRLDGKR
jgi:ribosomal protein L11 methyltransferase